MTKKLATHAERVAARHAINGQSNGYRPITEAELQALKAEKFRLAVEALEGDKRRQASLRAARPSEEMLDDMAEIALKLHKAGVRAA